MSAKKTISFRIPPSVDRLTRVIAAQQDMNRSQFILSAIQEKINRDLATRKPKLLIDADPQVSSIAWANDGDSDDEP